MHAIPQSIHSIPLSVYSPTLTSIPLRVAINPTTAKKNKKSKNKKDKQLFTTICFIYKNPISGEGPSDLCSLARSS